MKDWGQCGLLVDGSNETFGVIVGPWQEQKPGDSRGLGYQYLYYWGVPTYKDEISLLGLTQDPD